MAKVTYRWKVARDLKISVAHVGRLEWLRQFGYRDILKLLLFQNHTAAQRKLFFVAKQTSPTHDGPSERYIRRGPRGPKSENCAVLAVS